MNTKILVSLLVIGISAIAIGGTMTGAFFSDTETSTQNTFAAGAIDLKVDSQCSWNGLNCTRAIVPTPTIDLNTYWGGIPANGRCNCNWTLKDLNTTDRFFNFSDIKPGDTGENTISLHVNSNNAWVCAVVSNLTNAENNCTEPEGQVDTTCDNPGVGQGELQNFLVMTIWRDTNCNNILDNTARCVARDLTNTEDVAECTAIADQPSCIAFTDGDEEPLECTWVPGTGETVLASGPLVNGVLAVYDNTTGTGPLLGNTTGCVGMLWSLPNATGNIVQTDSMMGAISFSVVQSRNNLGFKCVV